MQGRDSVFRPVSAASELTTALALWNAIQCGDIRFR